MTIATFLDHPRGHPNAANVSDYEALCLQRGA